MLQKINSQFFVQEQFLTQKLNSMSFPHCEKSRSKMTHPVHNKMKV